MSALTWAAWILEVGVLVALCAGFPYPVVAYARNVLYRDGVVLFTAALACLTVGAVLELAVDATGAGPRVEVLAYVWYAASSVVSVGATWQFAREFVRMGESGRIGVDSDEFVGGFDDER